MIAVVVPPLGILAVIGTLWGVAVRPVDLALFGLFYVIPGLGITIGFHRYFTHRSFETSRPVKTLLAVLGSMTSRAPSASGSPTIASTMPTPTSRATPIRRTSGAGWA